MGSHYDYMDGIMRHPWLTLLIELGQVSDSYEICGFFQVYVEGVFYGEHKVASVDDNFIRFQNYENGSTPIATWQQISGLMVSYQSFHRWVSPNSEWASRFPWLEVRDKRY